MVEDVHELKSIDTKLDDLNERLGRIPLVRRRGQPAPATAPPGRRELQALVARDRLVGDRAGATLRPAMKPGSDSSASCTPSSASLSTYGIVAFVSAYVDVIGTAPGMFATQ